MILLSNREPIGVFLLFISSLDNEPFLAATKLSKDLWEGPSQCWIYCSLSSLLKIKLMSVEKSYMEEMEL